MMLNYPTFKKTGFPDGSDGKESTFNTGDLGLIFWVGKIPRRRAWQPTPVFLPGESPWTEGPGGLQSMRLQSRTQLSTQHHKNITIYSSNMNQHELNHSLLVSFKTI